MAKATVDPANGGTPAGASEWMIALGEQPANDELRVRFEAWLAASPDHRRDWEEIARTAEVLGRAGPLHRHEWGEFVEQRKMERREAEREAKPRAASARRGRRWRLGGLAVLAAAASFALVVGGDVMLRIEADHVTATAEQRQVRLADGTSVVLAPESAIDVAYGERARRVRLLKGRAYFEVAADRRPFAVEASGVEARDIGTAFDVGLQASEVDVAVRDGIVDVGTARNPRAERLLAGDWIRILPAGQIERGRMAPDQVASWTQGQLVVKNRSVTEVVDALRPYFRGMVIVRGATLGAQPLTGVYNLADPLEAFDAVARAQGAALYRLSPWLVVISGD